MTKAETTSTIQIPYDDDGVGQMHKEEFAAQLRSDGYSDIETKRVPPRPANVRDTGVPTRCVASFWLARSR